MYIAISLKIEYKISYKQIYPRSYYFTFLIKYQKNEVP